MKTGKKMEFKHQSVRDLAWAISSPPLISSPGELCLWPDYGWYQDAFDETLSILIDTDRDPTQLEKLLAQQKDRRLGKYFETMWAYWFERHPRYQIIASNLQIIIDGETLGEMDFIVLDRRSGKTMHWEVAVKFYLGVGDTRRLSGWHGPNLRDRLDLKVAHLQDRQSALSDDARVRRWLQQQSIEIEQCAVILKGRLYYPWTIRNEQLPESAVIQKHCPAECAPQHEYGWWLTRSQFDDEIADDEPLISLINRGYMEKISTKSVKNSITKTTMFENESNGLIRFPMQVQLCNDHRSWDRAFITGNEWPDYASKKT